MDIDVLFKAEHPKDTYPQHFCYSWASTEVNAACYRRSSSSQGWEQHWPMNISINIQKAVWQHVHIAVAGSPIGSIISTVIDLGPDFSIMLGFPPVVHALIPIRKWLLTPLTYRPPLHQWTHLVWQVSIAASVVCCWIIPRMAFLLQHPQVKASH